MNKLAVFSVCLGSVIAGTSSQAIDLKESKITQVINDVEIISSADQKEKTAAVNDIFSMPDLLRTGAASRAELIAPDETVTRVGANTIFSFDPANRTIDLKQGSLLFHAPHGKGGGAIHTGSATASVLGTTLIVVTTPNGGFKVIALEGQVEVRFLNGLKQKLDPGQMTFVLPGANQLAPVIIFRLDELTQNSLLVKGFIQPLDSLPLIQNQIDKQLKWISSGKVSDTGLYAGDNATPNQVEVLDINTINGNQNQSHQTQGPQQQPPPPGPPGPPPVPPSLSQAEAADATINQKSLVDVSIPTPPWHVFADTPFSVPGVDYFGGQTFSGFVAHDIHMNTPAAALDPLVVDLTAYSHHPSFDLVAINDFYLEGSVIFKGLASSENFGLIAGDQFFFTPGISLEADAHNFLISSPATLTFDNVALVNANQDINLNSAADVVFQNNSSVSAASRFIVNAGDNISAANSQFSGGSAFFTALNGGISLEGSTIDNTGHTIFVAPAFFNLTDSTISSEFVALSGTATTSVALNGSTISASSLLSISSIGDLNLTGTTPAPSSKPAAAQSRGSNPGSALVADPNTGTVLLSSTVGSVNVSGVSITAHYLTLNSGDGILLDGNGQTMTAAGTGATASFAAPNLVTVNNTDFSSFAVLNIAASTIVLANDILAPISNFATQTGLANFSGPVVPGEVNFFNCFWQGNPVTSALVTLSSHPGTTAGIYSYPR